MTSARLAAAGVLAWGSLHAQGVERRIEWRPTEPVQGSLIHVIVRPDSANRRFTVRATLAGQPLHFEQAPGGAYHALAGIPIGARASIPLVAEFASARDTVRDVVVRIPVRPGAFGSETLRVDPRFTAPPDSALAERIRRENLASRGVSERSHATPRLWIGPFVRPAAGRITSPFGKGREFNGEVTSRHLGTDFSGDRGHPVYAANRGVVALVGEFYYAGNVVYLDHGHGLVTAYLHLSEILVAQGDTVERGQLIGRIGATGRVTGPHLHFVTRYGTLSVNPLDLFDLDVTAFPDPPSAGGARP